MGTHPIFESDFDCLTEMASGKLYTYPDNFRADKIRAVAQISGFKLQVAPEYVHGVTNKTEEFQSKFFGKVPAFESGATALCDDTAIAHFVGNQQTRGGEKTEEVICWAGFAEANLLPAVAQWVWPTLRIVAPNKNHVNQAKEDLKAAFEYLNGILANQTFLVGERITYADITCALTLRSAYENVFTPEWRAPFSHVNRWFQTVINQPGVKSVVGDVTLCVKEAQFDAKNSLKSLAKLETRTRSLKRRKSSPKSRKRKKRPSLPPLPSPLKRLNPLIPGLMFPNSPWIWMPGSDFTPTTTKINPSNTSGPSSPLRSKSITPSGSATTNITTNSTWTSWPPTLSEECTSVLRSSENTLSPPCALLA